MLKKYIFVAKNNNIFYRENKKVTARMQNQAGNSFVKSDTGRIIREILESRGISQAAFAAELGITKARLNNYITNRSEADYATLRMIARLLGVSTDRLLGLEVETPTAGAVSCLGGEIVYSKDKPPVQKLEVDWLPVYASYSSAADLEDKAAPGMNTPLGWYAVPSAGQNSGGTLRQYGIVMSDDSMEPALHRGDLAIVQSTLFTHAFLSNNPYDEIFSVRLFKGDKVGCALKHCVVENNLLVCSAANKSCAPAVINMNKTTYIPIVGFVLSIIKTGMRRG